MAENPAPFSDTLPANRAAMDSDSSDTDEEEQLLELQQAVDANPTSYEAHTALVEALRACGELQRVREARKAMVARFPLTEDMWSAWLEETRE